MIRVTVTTERPIAHGIQPLITMRRARRSRASGREEAIDELFSTRGLEAELIARDADRHFSLRPFADGIPHDELVSTAPAVEAEPERLFRQAAEAVRRGRRGDAILRYRELLALEPGHLAGRNNLALLLDAAGEHAEALEQLAAGLRLDPDSLILLVTRGAMFGRLKRYGEAEADLRRALRNRARPILR